MKRVNNTINYNKDVRAEQMVRDLKDYLDAEFYYDTSKLNTAQDALIKCNNQIIINHNVIRILFITYLITFKGLLSSSQRALYLYFWHKNTCSSLSYSQMQHGKHIRLHCIVFVDCKVAPFKASGLHFIFYA